MPAGLAIDARVRLSSRAMPIGRTFSLFVLAPLAWFTLAVGGIRLRAEGARVPSTAAEPFFVKTAASLAELEKTLQGKGGHSSDLLTPGASAVEIVWRHEEDYQQKEVELHDGKDHVFFVTDGEATFILGGELVDPHETAKGEWRAALSRDSRSVRVGKGDLVFIPHGTVHSRSAKGTRFTMLQLSFWPGGSPAPKAAANVPSSRAAPSPAVPSPTAPVRGSPPRTAGGTLAVPAGSGGPTR